MKNQQRFVSKQPYAAKSTGLTQNSEVKAKVVRDRIQNKMRKYQLELIK